jgi:protein-tyrosine-phosphatase
MKANRTNVLFVCKYNVFRSKVAEAYFKKVNKNKNIKAKSAGIIGESIRNPKLTRTCKELGIKLKGKSKGLNIKLLKWADIIIIVANDVPKSIFTYNGKYLRKVILWKMQDVFSTEKDISIKQKKVMGQIMKKVDELNKDLRSGKLK